VTRIVHITQPVDGGVGRVVADVAAAQRALGCDVAVASPPGWLAGRLTDAGIPWLRWDARRAPGQSVPRELADLRRLLAQQRPDVVHLHSSKAGLVGRLLVRSATPTIFSPHGWAWQAVTGPVARSTVRWERWATRWTHALVCVSEAELRAGAEHGVQIRRAFGPGRGAHVVPNGVDLRTFRPADTADRAEARRLLGLDVEVPIALCVGRLNDQKGQDVLVRAWPLVQRVAPGAQLVLLGDGPSGAELVAAARRLGVADLVRLEPPTERVETWYAAADVVVLSSRHGEAMPLTPLEAMACGRSVVATDVAGVRESLGPGCGAVVPVADAEALAVEVARRLDHEGLRRAEGVAGRSWAVQHFDVSETGRRLAALAESLLAMPSRS
jgi:glycosyltransferase involved in cell wall biosynthesis